MRIVPKACILCRSKGRNTGFSFSCTAPRGNSLEVAQFKVSENISTEWHSSPSQVYFALRVIDLIVLEYSDWWAVKTAFVDSV